MHNTHTHTHTHAHTHRRTRTHTDSQLWQELVAEAYGVDVHLHSFFPRSLRTGGDAEGEEDAEGAGGAEGAEGAGGAEGAEGEAQRAVVDWEWQTESLYPRSTLPSGMPKRALKSAKKALFY